MSSEESQASPKKPVSVGTWIDSTAMVVCRFVDSKVEKATIVKDQMALPLLLLVKTNLNLKFPMTL